MIRAGALDLQCGAGESLQNHHPYRGRAFEMTGRAATRHIALFCLAALCLPLIGCFFSVKVDEARQSRGEGQFTSEPRNGRYEGTFRTIVPLQEAMLVEVTVPGGTIDVEGWDRPQLEVEATKRVKATTDEQAEEIGRDIEIEVEEYADGVTIVTTPPWEREEHASINVSFLLRVPSSTDLVIETTNGNIAVREVAGRHDLAAVNGSILLADVGGDVDAAAINGSITAMFDYVDLSQEDITLETVNGSITVSLTPTASVVIDATAANGEIVSDYHLIDEEREELHGYAQLRGHLGAGEGSLELTVTNGSIRIK
jgi:hypothetical protein